MIQVFRILAPHNGLKTILFQQTSSSSYLMIRVPLMNLWGSNRPGSRWY